MNKSSFITICIIFITVSAVTVSAKDKGEKHGKEKVTICHKGKNITVSESAVKAHLNHGDSLGPCPEIKKNSENNVNVKKEYIYMYYPDSSVYFDQGKNLWHYLVNGKWITDKILPQSFNIIKTQGIRLNLETDKPYMLHNTIKAKYPSVTIKEYNYKYYPNSSVYFDESKKIYHYLHEGKWNTCPALPEYVKIVEKEAVRVDMKNDNPPYTRHDEIIKMYPSKKKATICHKGKTITVSESSVNSHINNHGDTIGPCPDSSSKGHKHKEKEHGKGKHK